MHARRHCWIVALFSKTAATWCMQQPHMHAAAVSAFTQPSSHPPPHCRAPAAAVAGPPRTLRLQQLSVHLVQLLPRAAQANQATGNTLKTCALSAAHCASPGSSRLPPGRAAEQRFTGSCGPGSGPAGGQPTCHPSCGTLPCSHGTGGCRHGRALVVATRVVILQPRLLIVDDQPRNLAHLRGRINSRNVSWHTCGGGPTASRADTSVIFLHPPPMLHPAPAISSLPQLCK